MGLITWGMKNSGYVTASIQIDMPGQGAYGQLTGLLKMNWGLCFKKYFLEFLYVIACCSFLTTTFFFL